MQVSIGFSQENDYIKACKEAVSQALLSIEIGKVNLVLLLSTTNFNHPLALKTLSTFFDNASFIGLSSPKIICNGGVFKKGLAIALFGFPEEIYFNATCVKDISKDNGISLGEKLGEDLLYGCKGNRRNLSIMFSNSNVSDGLKVLSGLQERIGRSFPMVGGFVSSSLYFEDAVLNNAFCGILFGGRLNFGLGIQHGWKPIGKTRMVTKSLGNTIYEIDGNKAASLYQDYFAKDISGLRKDLKHISTLYPLGVDIANKKEYLLRSLSSIEDNGALIFNGDIAEGSKVRLMIASKDSCLESTRQAAITAREGLKNQKIKFALIFNSLARSIILNRQEKAEIEMIQGILGKDVQIIGACTLAEEAPISSTAYLGKAYFHNNSIAILTMAS